MEDGSSALVLESKRSLSTILVNGGSVCIAVMAQVFCRNVRTFVGLYSCKDSSYAFSITGVFTWPFYLNNLQGINKE